VTAIFPALPGLGWSVTKSAKFATRIQRAVNGRELRALDQPNPIWSWTLTYPLLRDKWDTRAGGLGTGYDELRTLAGLFLQQQGAFQPFLFDDPTDHAVTAGLLGTGDSSATQYQLVRTMGGFAEPIAEPIAGTGWSRVRVTRSDVPAPFLLAGDAKAIAGERRFERRCGMIPRCDRAEPATAC